MNKYIIIAQIIYTPGQQQSHMSHSLNRSIYRFAHIRNVHINMHNYTERNRKLLQWWLWL